MNEAIRVKECILSQILSKKRQKTSGPTPHNFFSILYLLKWRHIQLIIIRISTLVAKVLRRDIKNPSNGTYL
jgi:hypothetical protein